MIHMWAPCIIVFHMANIVTMFARKKRLAQFEVFAVELSGAAAEAPHRRPCLGTVDRV